jgi:broad specificity phosphatase PhoE
VRLKPAGACETCRVRLVLLARHGESVFNVDGIVNGDPLLDQGLSGRGIQEAEGFGVQIAGFVIDLCIVSEFPHAQQTAELALAIACQDPPRIVDSGLNDIRIGKLEGRTLDDYRRWKSGRKRGEPFPGGESLDEAARRYADAYERVLQRPEHSVLVVCHEIPVRYAVNAAANSNQLDGPFHDVANATPYLLDADGLRRAVDGIRELKAVPEAAMRSDSAP